VNDAVHRVLAEPGYRTAAKSAAQEIAEAGGVEELLAVITEVARSTAA
jgi:UDP:flavonoid glycosyltransferase YjiC (YdhE family)